MLRLIVLILLLLNGVYYAWSQGLLKVYGLAPVQATEPQRITGQLRAQALRVLSGDEMAKMNAPASTATSPRPAECLQAGLFDETQAIALRRTLESVLPGGAWQLDTVVEPARWIIYMGKFPDAQAVAAKRNQLTQLKLKPEPLLNPELELGLSLGAHSTRSAAQEELENLKRRGVRTARIVEERPEMRKALLRVTAVDDVLKVHQDELKSVLAGKSLRACK
ncbi:MAG: hypothetical protein RL211_1933 [Pseudomonadota bacterium]|jgi:hypothetical protein